MCQRSCSKSRLRRVREGPHRYTGMVEGGQGAEELCNTVLALRMMPTASRAHSCLGVELATKDPCCQLGSEMVIRSCYYTLQNLRREDLYRCLMSFALKRRRSSLAHECAGLLQSKRLDCRISGSEEQCMQRTPYSILCAPFPGLPAEAEHETMGNFERLEELVWLKEGLDEAGVDDAKHDKREEEPATRPRHSYWGDATSAVHEAPDLQHQTRY